MSPYLNTGQQTLCRSHTASPDEGLLCAHALKHTQKSATCKLRASEGATEKGRTAQTEHLGVHTHTAVKDHKPVATETPAVPDDIKGQVSAVAGKSGQHPLSHLGWLSLGTALCESRKQAKPTDAAQAASGPPGEGKAGAIFR